MEELERTDGEVLFARRLGVYSILPKEQASEKVDQRVAGRILPCRKGTGQWFKFGDSNLTVILFLFPRKTRSHQFRWVGPFAINSDPPLPHCRMP